VSSGRKIVPNDCGSSERPEARELAERRPRN
jgi:hypothetical protein